MENASKALLIAGSVLIAIVLIAVGIKILSSTSGITEQVGKVSTTMEASIFNSQFLQYEGRQTGVKIKSLYRNVISNNVNYPDKTITLYRLYDLDDVDGGEHFSIEMVENNVIYDVSMEDKNNDGFIDYIEVIGE